MHLQDETSTTHSSDKQWRIEIKWSQPKEKKEPYTAHMFTVLDKIIESLPAEQYVQTLWVVYDWQRLGIFTGSCISKYAQETTTIVSQVPNTWDAGIWANALIAFIAKDFIFFDNDLCLVPHNKLYHQYKKGNVYADEIRFRFDKSPRNFSFRRYTRTNVPIYCPVDACIHIFQRTGLLRINTIQSRFFPQHCSVLPSVCWYQFQELFCKDVTMAVPHFVSPQSPSQPCQCPYAFITHSSTFLCNFTSLMASF